MKSLIIKLSIVYKKSVDRENFVPYYLMYTTCVQHVSNKKGCMEESNL